ncbi:hypothetical protein C449_14372 [Halococcus saccharolyticus DSM 5350]|uniref:Nudix hydrolase domain-containing protein n=1 Tax=Halococcus saccharolyticus DSM 5350 TaxID=1227455 RepID=M0MBP6_9EURY|nr:hypothetical protein C449_14372 [Halococcus saccharolyticus DSM 5350]
MDGKGDDRWTVTDPAAVAERSGVAFEQRTYERDDVEHCETDAAGRVVVGITDGDERLLLVVNSEDEFGVLPNEAVDPEEDWAAVGRWLIEEMTGTDTTLNGVRAVREVEHVVDGEKQSQTHHVVFGGSLADSDAILDGVCDDNSWELRWFDAMPTWLDDEARGVYADIELFVGEDG